MNELVAKIRELKAAYPDADSALLPILHWTQDRYGFITPEALETIGAELGLTVAYLEGVVSFYTLFRTRPLGRFHIQICGNISCSLCGAERLIRHVEERLGVPERTPTPDGLFSWETVECLAACGYAPALQVNLRYYYNVDEAKFDRILDAIRTTGEAPGEALEVATDA
jgi:NADH-quinone oxidoreductase subunit E